MLQVHQDLRYFAFYQIYFRRSKGMIISHISNLLLKIMFNLLFQCVSIYKIRNFIIEKIVISFYVSYFIISSIIGSNFALFALFLQSNPKFSLFIDLKKSISIAFFAFCLDFRFIKTNSLLKRASSSVQCE